MSDKAYLKANPDIVFREEEGGAFLFNSSNCVLKGLNDAGKLVWELCDGTRTEDEILKDVFAVYPDAGQDEIRKDVFEFIKYLKEIDYIREK